MKIIIFSLLLFALNQANAEPTFFNGLFDAKEHLFRTAGDLSYHAADAVHSLRDKFHGRGGFSASGHINTGGSLGTSSDSTGSLVVSNDYVDRGSAPSARVEQIVSTPQEPTTPEPAPRSARYRAFLAYHDDLGNTRLLSESDICDISANLKCPSLTIGRVTI